MIQPGKQSNPTSSGTVGLQGVLGQGIYKVDGFTITIGIVVLLVAAFLLFQMMAPKRRR